MFRTGTTRTTYFDVVSKLRIISLEFRYIELLSVISFLLGLYGFQNLAFEIIPTILFNGLIKSGAACIISAIALGTLFKSLTGLADIHLPSENICVFVYAVHLSTYLIKIF